MEILVFGAWDTKSVGGAVTEMPSTLLMNIIVGDGFHCLYPNLISQRKGILNIPDDLTLGDVSHNTVSLPLLQLLQNIGFSLLADPNNAIGTHKCGMHPSCTLTLRGFL